MWRITIDSSVVSLFTDKIWFSIIGWQWKPGSLYSLFSNSISKLILDASTEHSRRLCYWNSLCRAFTWNAMTFGWFVNRRELGLWYKGWSLEMRGICSIVFKCVFVIWRTPLAWWQFILDKSPLNMNNRVAVHRIWKYFLVFRQTFCIPKNVENPNTRTLIKYMFCIGVGSLVLVLRFRSLSNVQLGFSCVLY